MNIMLATVRSRIREIGIRKALGATFREIQMQFLAEAVLISLSGGVVGTVLAMLLPLSIAFFTGYRLQVSWLSAVIAILVSCAVGDRFWYRSRGTCSAHGSCRITEVRVTEASTFFAAQGKFFIALVASTVYPRRASNTILVLSSFCFRSPHRLKIPRLNSASSRY